VNERRSIINQQCDSLINEVEVKREFFLSDLEYEEKSKCECLTQLIDGCRQQGTSLENLIQYTRDVLRETDPCAFIQVTFLYNVHAALSVLQSLSKPQSLQTATDYHK